MSTRVTLGVRLKVPDTTAQSAEDTLRRNLGYDGTLESLRREDWWCFEVATDDPGAARACVRQWADRCTALVNPNKHRAALDAPRGRAEGTETSVLVRDREDLRAASMLRFLRSALGASDLVSLESGVLWTLRFRPGAGDPRALADDIARTRSRTRGLLANPHAQTVDIGGRT
jgi:hypothetical protein